MRPSLRPTTLALLLFVLGPSTAGQRSSAPRDRQGPSVHGDFQVIDCSLGLAPGPNGLTCIRTDIAVNRDVRVTFNQPVDLRSVTNRSLQFLDLATGLSALYFVAIDPRDPRTLVIRPLVSFDSSGNPLFGLLAGRQYLFRIRGREQDPLRDYVTSVDGTPNRTRLECALLVSGGVVDVVPGRPRVKVYVEAVLERDPETGEPVRTGRVPAEDAVDVMRSTAVELVFDDVMNPSTLANPVTGTSTFLRVHFDPDGDVTNPSDQVPVAGSFNVTLNQTASTSHVVFAPFERLPVSGPSRRPARVVLLVSSLVSDLGGNTLSNPGQWSFTTAPEDFP
jgi:hypothetical protein